MSTVSKAKKQQITKNDIMLAAFEALYARHGGRLSPADVLEEAREPSSPLHDCFEWDDDVAAEQYRLAQAGQLIRKWRGSVIKIDQVQKVITVTPVRRVQSPLGSRAKGAASYMSVESIMADPELREDMIHTVLRELMAYRKRYAELTALADIWRAIDDANDLHAPQKKKPGDAAGKDAIR